MSTKLRKLMIVIEDDGSQGGKGFLVYLTGDKERIGRVNERDMSPAEWWGSKLFRICTDAITKAGAVTSTFDTRKKDGH